MCQVLGVSKSGFYAFCGKPPSKRDLENQALTQRIKEIYDLSRGNYGSPRIHAELKSQAISCSKNRVARLMQEAKLKAKVHQRKKWNPCPHYEYPEVSNQLQRCFYSQAPNQVWVSDITYIQTKEGWLYLTVIIDLYSRKVISYTIQPHMRREIVIDAFLQAVLLREPSEGLIFHSDRGMQYISDQFQDCLRQYGVISSMSRKGNCYDNAVAESFFHTLKNELVRGRLYQTKAEARASLVEYIVVFYNNKRRHSFLNYLAPAEFERQSGYS